MDHPGDDGDHPGDRPGDNNDQQPPPEIAPVAPMDPAQTTAPVSNMATRDDDANAVKARMLERQRQHMKKKLAASSEPSASSAPQPMLESETGDEHAFTAEMLALKNQIEAAKKQISALKVSNQDTMGVEIKLLQHQKEFAKRLRKANTDLTDEATDLRPDELFVAPSAPPPAYPQASFAQMSDVNLFPGMAEMLKSHLANPDTASGHNEFAEEREKAKGKRGRKPANGKTSKAPAAKRKARVAKPKKPTQKEIARERRADNLFNKHNLLGGDLFHDVHSNVARSSGPTFTATKKQDALKQLVASIPSEQQHLAKIDKDQLKDALRWFTPAKSVQPDAVKDGWKMVGMKSTLSHYQMLGVSYMRQREQSEEHPKGGILADAMGLGKTVMMLANICNAYRKKENQTTLIVATSSLVQQWDTELGVHVERGNCGTLMRYHAGSKMQGTPANVAEAMTKFGIVLTTYADVMKSYPKWAPGAELTTAEDKAIWWNRHYHENKGALHTVEWTRVVLDEAQAIKSVDSQTSIACRSLSAEFRWAMSGTPVQNRLEEFYPYFRFLKAPNTGSLRVFRENFCSRGDGPERLNLLLRTFMIRRTHGDSLFGAKLLDLKPPSKHDHIVHLSKIEREIYEVVRRRFVARINGFIKTGNLQKRYSNVLTMLLRLRQIVCHPLLVQDSLRDLLEKEDFDALRRICDEPKDLHMTDWHIRSHLRLMLKHEKEELPPIDRVSPSQDAAIRHASTGHTEATSQETGMEMETGLTTGVSTAQLDASMLPDADSIPMAAAEGSEAILPAEDAVMTRDEQPTDALEPTIPTGDAVMTIDEQPDGPNEIPPHNLLPGGNFGFRNDYGSYITELETSSAMDDIEVVEQCTRCGQKPRNPHKISCGHVYGVECLMQMTEAALNAKLPLRCLACGAVNFHGSNVNHGPMPTVKTSDSRGSPAPDAADREAMRALRKLKIRPADIVNRWVDGQGNQLPSAKTLAFTAQVENWLQEDPAIKVIVYTQFISMVHILSRICEMEKWGYVTFTGSHTIDQRAKVIDDFRDRKDAQIMIASLRTGGTGLNLTMACRMIMIDLWWNTAVEDQAFARTYRRGQDKETRLTRFIVDDSIDTQMVGMQKRKEAEIGQVVDNETRSRKKVSVEQLLTLFGPLAPQDAHGKAFLIVDDTVMDRRPPRFARRDDDEAYELGDEQ